MILPLILLSAVVSVMIVGLLNACGLTWLISALAVFGTMGVLFGFGLFASLCWAAKDEPAKSSHDDSLSGASSNS